MRRAFLVSLVTVVAVVLVTSMRPLTPARTFGAYELKARGTAKSALSAVETARLAARAGSDGRAFGTYVSVLLSESETGLGHAEETFLSIQPPDRRADALRVRLARLLDRSRDHVAQLRISARRGDLESLAPLSEPLRSLAHRLGNFI